MGLSTWWSGRKAGRLHEEGMRLAKERDWAQAEAALRQAVELRTAVLGAEDPSTLRSRGQRAAVLRRLDRTDEGVAELDACVAALARTLGDTARPVVEMRLLRGQVLHKAGRPAEAEADARQVTQAMDGQVDVLTYRAAVLLGSALDDLGRHEEASDAFAAPVALFTDLSAGTGKLPLFLRSRRLQCLLRLGRYAEAETEATDLRTAFGSVYGERDAVLRRRVDPTPGSLAFALCGSGRPEEGERVVREALADLASVGVDAPVSLRLNLARCLRAQNRFEEAWEAVEAARASFAARTSLTNAPAGAECALGTSAAATLIGLDRPAEAEKEAAEAVELCRRTLGPAHHQRLRAEHLYAVAVDRQGRHDEAAPLLADNHAAWLAAFGADHPGTVAAAAALSACGRTEGAAPAGG